MTWHKSTGKLSYGPGIRVVLSVDQGIVDYYLRLIPKYLNVVPQAYEAHVSVIRKEKPMDTSAWGDYNGDKVEFEYGDKIENDETYYWLDVRCQRLKEIRKELGLPEYPPWRNGFHLTLGNVKHSGRLRRWTSGTG